MSVYIKTDDGRLVKVSIELVNDSEYLKFMIELSENDDNDDIIISVPTINYNDLSLLITSYNSMNIDDLNLEDLIKIINISNFLELNKLFLKSVNKIRNIIKSHNTEELRNIFNEKNDFTENELELIKKKDGWCKYRDCYDSSGFINNLL